MHATNRYVLNKFNLISYQGKFYLENIQKSNTPGSCKLVPIPFQIILSHILFVQ